jgi:hypothetical protein
MPDLMANRFDMDITAVWHQVPRINPIVQTGHQAFIDYALAL